MSNLPLSNGCYIEDFIHYLDSLPSKYMPSLHWSMQNEIGKKKGFEPYQYIIQVSVLKTKYPNYHSWEHIKGFGRTLEESIKDAKTQVEQYIKEKTL